MSETFIIKPLREDLYTGFRFEKNFKNFEVLPEITVSQLKNKKVHLVLEPPLFFLDVTEIPGKIPSFLQVQANLRARESGIFISPPKTIYKVIETTDTTSKVFIFSVEEKIINQNLELIRMSQAKIEIVTHKILSTFSLLKTYYLAKISDFPILLIILDSDGIWYLVCSEKHPIYARFSAIDEFIGFSSQTLLEDIFTLKDYIYRFQREELKGLLILGKEREKALKEKEVLKDAKIPIIELDISPEILTHPEIFGTVYLDDEYNFLPDYEKIFFKHLKLIEKLTPILASLVFVSAVTSGIFYKFNSELENKIENELNFIRNSLHELSLKLPESKIEKVKTFIDLEKKKRENLRLDQFLIWLSHTWEKSFTLKDLAIEASANSTYKFYIELEINGDFLYTHKKSEEIVRNLSNYFVIEKNNFIFSGKENKGILNLELTLKK